MANIGTNVKQGKVYQLVTQYSSDWDLMFENAHQYNEDGSMIYKDLYTLQRVFKNALEAATKVHRIVLEDPGYEDED
ncbi:hypothetical protein BT96DRAFT_991623 [Gymnopus androsaceus JB14]|uniref:Bromo domain-containing protein n=1 Tax=Gymnopus androsaceus JB14 TaxID=1447944 RepID=A0A6A4HYF1_9AGAR|nr:hypothetical protein BT96DRAFT_991623 [Gymnopus androsaceus JB14]